MRPVPTRLASLVAATCLLVAACGNDNADKNARLTSARADRRVAGNVSVSGSSTVQPISSIAGESFQGQNRRVDVSVEGPGTGDGFERFCEGGVDITGASRPIEPEELVLELPANGAAANGMLGAAFAGLALREAREMFEREYLIAQINRFGGNISRTASFVGMERSALHRKLKSLNVIPASRSERAEETELHA